MKSILKATAVLGSVSVVTILCGLISAKVAALILGPNGVGYMGLLQSLLGLSTLIGGMGIGVGLVRAGAKALAQDDPRQVAALRRAAWVLCAGLGGLTVAALIVLREQLSRIMLGGAGHDAAVMAIGVALLLGLAAGIQTSILNAHHRIGALAKVGILSSLLGAAFTVLLIWQLRAQGIVPALLATLAISWAVSFYYLRSRVRAERFDLSRGEVLSAAGALLRFGMPYTGSMIVGAGVLMIVPVLILHALGPADVGFYRAASAIAINYLGFLVTTMSQDYYPRVSAASDEPGRLNQLINDQLRLVLLLGGPTILCALALVPSLLPLVYSSQFSPAGELLEWQLIGDLFKFSAWTMSFVILSRLGGMTYFCTELFGGTMILLCSWLGMRWFGLNGLGMAFMITTACACLLAWFILRRDMGLRWSRGNKLLFWTFTGAMAIVRALPSLGVGNLRTPVALVLAVSLGSLSLYLIWREVDGWQGLMAWRRRARGVGDGILDPDLERG